MIKKASAKMICPNLNSCILTELSLFYYLKKMQFDSLWKTITKSVLNIYIT